MRVMSRRVSMPHPGKTALVVERAKTVSSVIERAGGNAMVAKIIYGDKSGAIGLFGVFEDFAAACAASEAMALDPKFQTLTASRESSPAGDMSGPDVLSIIYGEIPLSSPVAMIRTYHMDRNNRGHALEILEKIDSLVGDDVRLAANAPLIGPNMDAMNVVYGFNSMSHMGQSVQEVGFSPEFQALVNEANTLGKLTSSRVQIRV
jgi:hypothetical protein